MVRSEKFERQLYMDQGGAGGGLDQAPTRVQVCVDVFVLCQVGHCTKLEHLPHCDANITPHVTLSGELLVQQRLRRTPGKETYNSKVKV